MTRHNRNPSTLPLSALLLLLQSLPTIYATVTGPVMTQQFPDPSLISVSSIWYAFGTGTTTGSNVPYASSADFDTWTLAVDANENPLEALPTLPDWVDADSPQVWAPDVSLLSDGSYIMYFCAQFVNDTGHHCVGAATSTSITGPYTPTSDEPLFCPTSSGGAIDASGFLDTSGQRYVVYKVDGNSIGNGGNCGNTVDPIVATPIMLQPVEDDGVTSAGDSVTLLNNNSTADDGIVEAPSLYQYSDTDYILFFSSGCFSTPDYTVSYATSTTGINGPYTRRGALLANGTDDLVSPGGMDIDADGQHMLFHATVGSQRDLYTAVMSVASDLSVSV